MAEVSRLPAYLALLVSEITPCILAINLNQQKATAAETTALPALKKTIPPIKRPPTKEPDSRAVSAKAAAGLPHSKVASQPLFLMLSQNTSDQ